MKLSPLQAEHKKQRSNLNALCVRILSAFSFKQITTWRDVYKFMGISPDAMPPNMAQPVSYPELKKYLEELKQKLEERLSGESPVVPVITAPPVAKVAPAPWVIKQPEQVAVVTPVAATLGAQDEYGWKPSPNENVFFYWFQKKAIAQAMSGILGE